MCLCGSVNLLSASVVVFGITSVARTVFLFCWLWLEGERLARLLLCPSAVDCGCSKSLSVLFKMVTGERKPQTSCAVEGPLKRL